MRAAKIYPLQIPASGSFPLIAEGSFFKVLTASGSFEVAGDTFGVLGTIQPGQGLRLDGGIFRRLTFRDLSGAANNLSVLIADDGFIDDRVAGEVNVIDGGKLLTVAGVNYTAGAGLASAAGNFPMIQLVNASAVRRVVIKGMVWSVDKACVVLGHISGTARLNVVANSIANRLSGGPIPQASILRSDNTLSAVPADLSGTPAQFYVQHYGATVNPVEHRFPEPIVLGLNQCFTLWSNTATGPTLNVMFEYTEELI